MIHGWMDLLEYFIDKYIEPDMRVLDAGSGTDAVSAFVDKGCKLTGVTFCDLHSDKYEIIQNNLLFYRPDQLFDAIWCAHTLEHIPNTQLFLRRLINMVSPGGVMGILVPPGFTHNLVGGHVNLFSPGTLCYNIILAGQDLSNATVIQYQYNTAVFWHRTDISLPVLKHDRGDIETLSQFFPKPVHQNCSAQDWLCNADDFIYREFEKQYGNLMSSFDPEVISPFYYNIERLWNRYHTALKHAQTIGCQKGLDFGVGSCAGLILSQIMRVPHLSGLDIIKIRGKSKNRFWPVQQKWTNEKSTSNSKHHVIHCDTDNYPWPIKDSMYDFVFCFDSLFTEWKEHVDWKTDPIRCLPRIKEIMRILKPKGALYIGGGSEHGKDIEKFLELNVINSKEVSFYHAMYHTIEQVSF